MLKCWQLVEVSVISKAVPICGIHSQACHSKCNIIRRSAAAPGVCQSCCIIRLASTAKVLPNACQNSTTESHSALESLLIDLVERPYPDGGAVWVQGRRASLPSATIMLRQPMNRFQQMQASDIDIYRNEVRKTKTEIVRPCLVGPCTMRF